ncbi:MAG: hypothetical protein ACYDBB_12310 [Armatimonadota bacterium]
MNARYWLWCMLLIIAVMPVLGADTVPAKATMEVVRTAEGTFYVWHRTPAERADLGMPIFNRGLVLDSFTYRVRDRKRRDKLFYARTVLTTTLSADEVVRFYQRHLGNGAQKQVDAGTGETSLSSGTKEHFRLVTITPAKDYAQIRLEHVQHFTIPPRVYTSGEQRVIRVLEDIAANYRTARHVAYTVEQQVAVPPQATPAAPPHTLVWTIDFTRPDSLHIVARVDDVIGLEINTDGDHLVVKRQEGEPEQRSLAKGLGIELLPELQDDTAARMLLGEQPISPEADYLALLPVDGVPMDRQVEVVITYPEREAKLFLFVDLTAKIILRSEIEVKVEKETVRMLRTYSNILVESAPAATAAVTPSPQPSTTDAPAMKGP